MNRRIVWPVLLAVFTLGVLNADARVCVRQDRAAVHPADPALWRSLQFWT